MSKASFVKLAMGVGVIALSSVATHAAEGSYSWKSLLGNCGVSGSLLGSRADAIHGIGKDYGVAFRGLPGTTVTLDADTRVFHYVGPVALKGFVSVGYLGANALKGKGKGVAGATSNPQATGSTSDSQPGYLREEQDLAASIAGYGGVSVNYLFTNYFAGFTKVGFGVATPFNANWKHFYPVFHASFGGNFDVINGALLELAVKHVNPIEKGIQNLTNFSVGLRYTG